MNGHADNDQLQAGFLPADYWRQQNGQEPRTERQAQEPDTEEGTAKHGEVRYPRIERAVEFVHSRPLITGTCASWRRTRMPR